MIFKSRHNDIALMSMFMTGTLCSFMRNIIFKSCFLLSEYGSTDPQIQTHVPSEDGVKTHIKTGSFSVFVFSGRQNMKFNHFLCSFVDVIHDPLGQKS